MLSNYDSGQSVFVCVGSNTCVIDIGDVKTTGQSDSSRNEKVSSLKVICWSLRY